MSLAHSPQVLETLRAFDSPTVSNVIELFDLRPRTAGYMNASIRALYPKLPPIVGYATTATFRSAYPATGRDLYMRLADYAIRMEEIPAPRIVVYQDLDTPPAAATLGEILCTLYKRFGCDGFITSGGARDLGQIEALHFPVFASCILVSHGYGRIEEMQVPVHVGGLIIRPGDLLHADANGVVLIPHAIASEVADACKAFVNIEKIYLDYLQRSDATPKGLKNVLNEVAVATRELSTALKTKTMRKEGKCPAD